MRRSRPCRRRILLYISSDAVYADDANPVTERSPLRPRRMHGMMHAARELMLRSELRQPFAVLRPTLIYGARDPHSGYGPNRFRRQAAKGEPITLFGEGEEKRDHVAVEDVAQPCRAHPAHAAAPACSMSSPASRPRSATSPKSSRASLAGAGQIRAAAWSAPHLLHRFFDITMLRHRFPFRAAAPACPQGEVSGVNSDVQLRACARALRTSKLSRADRSVRDDATRDQPARQAAPRQAQRRRARGGQDRRSIIAHLARVRRALFRRPARVRLRRLSLRRPLGSGRARTWSSISI